MTRVGVVGAGITGLALTHSLEQHGVEPVTFEAEAAPGGVIQSTRRDGVVLDHGPQRLRVTDRVASLVDEFGLGDDLVTGDPDLPLFVYADGRLRSVPTSIAGVVATDLLTLRGKLRALLEPVTAPISPDESVAAAAERKFGREVAERIIGPLVGGIYASTPDRLPAGHALEPLIAIESREGSLLRAALRRMRSQEVAAPATFADGLQTLPEAMADRHADRIRFGEPVDAIERVDGGYRLSTVRGGADVDAVVLTVPAPVAGDLVAGIAPTAGEELAELTYNPLAVVHLRSDVERAGFGYQVAAGTGLRTLGVTWNASLFDRDGVYTCFLGGMQDPEIVDEPSAVVGRIAREEFEAVMGCRADVLEVTQYRTALPAYDRSWAALDGLDLPMGIHLAANYTGRLGIPGRLREADRVAALLAGERAPNGP